MTAFDAPDRRGPSERVYAGLIQLYPAAFRERYREEMVRLFADQLRDARAGRGFGGVVMTWLRTLASSRSIHSKHCRRRRDGSKGRSQESCRRETATFGWGRTTASCGLMANSFASF